MNESGVFSTLSHLSRYLDVKRNLSGVSDNVTKGVVGVFSADPCPTLSM